MNPYHGDQGAADAGRALYAQHCTSCHGPAARGQGELAADLVPPPSDLVELVHGHGVTDGYLYWRIWEGGEMRGTAMPSWGDTLNEDEVWEIVTHLRELAAEEGGGGEEHEEGEDH